MKKKLYFLILMFFMAIPAMAHDSADAVNFFDTTEHKIYVAGTLVDELWCGESSDAIGEVLGAMTDIVYGCDFTNEEKLNILATISKQVLLRFRGELTEEEIELFKELRRLVYTLA